MGKIGKFFKKLAGGIKKGATKVWNFGKTAVQKVGHVLRPLADVAEKVGGLMSNLPGKAGMIGTGLAAGGSTVKTITDMLPDSKAKTKIEEALNKGLDTGQQWINKGTDVLNKVNNKAQPWIHAGVDISRKLADGADTLSARLNNVKVMGYTPKTPVQLNFSKGISAATKPIGGINPIYKMTPEQRAAFEKQMQEDNKLRSQVRAEAQRKLLSRGLLL